MARRIDTQAVSYGAQLTTNQAEPATPPAGYGRLWIDDRTAKIKMSDGTNVILVGEDGTTVVTTELSRSQLDAFGRPIASSPFTVFDSKQIFNEGSAALSLYYDDAEVSGGGTSSTYVPAESSTRLATTLNTAGRRTRQTYRRFNYQPGKAQQAILTANLSGGVANNDKRLGYFDDNDGVFFELNGSGMSVNIRNSGVDTSIAEAAWTYEGELFSTRGYTMDYTKTQIFLIDFEWLGVGTVRFGFQIDGVPVWVHEQHHANIETTVYMRSPNLPIRYEIENDGTGAAASMDSICSTVISFGGQQVTGQTIGFSRGNTTFATQADNDIYPLMSFRLRSGWEGTNAIPISLSISSNTTPNFRWVVLRNPTVAGVDAASWVTTTQSGIEYDISRDNTNKLSGGYQIATGYGTNEAELVAANIVSTLLLGVDIAGTSDEFVLGVQNVFGSQAETYLASVNWQELN